MPPRRPRLITSQPAPRAPSSSNKIFPKIPRETMIYSCHGLGTSQPLAGSELELEDDALANLPRRARRGAARVDALVHLHIRVSRRELGSTGRCCPVVILERKESHEVAYPAATRTCGQWTRVSGQSRRLAEASGRTPGLAPPARGPRQPGAQAGRTGRPPARQRGGGTRRGRRSLSAGPGARRGSVRAEPPPARARCPAPPR